MIAILKGVRWYLIVVVTCWSFSTLWSILLHFLMICNVEYPFMSVAHLHFLLAGQLHLDFLQRPQIPPYPKINSFIFPSTLLQPHPDPPCVFPVSSCLFSIAGASLEAGLQTGKLDFLVPYHIRIMGNATFQTQLDGILFFNEISPVSILPLTTLPNFGPHHLFPLLYQSAFAA